MCFVLAAIWTSPRVTFAQSEPPVQRPSYDVLRFREDWSVLREPERLEDDDFFDPIKYIPLSDDGEVWLSFGGQGRLRLESWEDFNFSGANDDAFLLSRLRYHADLHVGPNLRVFVEGKNAYSTDRDLPGGKRTLEVDELDLQNAFIDLGIPLGEWKLTLRGGRQEMLFGRQRLVSPLDWANTRRTFDGFSGIFSRGTWTVTGFWTRPVPVQKYDFNDSDANTDFYGIYATGKIPDSTLGLDLYWLGFEADTATFNGTTGDERRHTLGGRLFGRIGESGWDYDAEAAWQVGELDSEDINAWMMASQIGYTFAGCAATPRLFAGLDYASGDHSPGGGVETFNQLFPLGHLYLGWIDTVGRQNVIDLSAGVSAKPLEKLTVQLHGHLFWRADNDDALYNAGGGVVRPGAAANDRFVGSELDLLLEYRINRHLTASFGYSHFFPGAFIEKSGSGNGIDFIYAALEYTF